MNPYLADQKGVDKPKPKAAQTQERAKSCPPTWNNSVNVHAPVHPLASVSFHDAISSTYNRFTIGKQLEYSNHGAPTPPTKKVRELYGTMPAPMNGSRRIGDFDLTMRTDPSMPYNRVPSHHRRKIEATKEKSARILAAEMLARGPDDIKDEEARLHDRIRKMELAAAEQIGRSQKVSPLMVCILDTQTSQGGLLRTKAGIQVSFSLQVKYSFGNQLSEGGDEIRNWVERMGGFTCTLHGPVTFDAEVWYQSCGVFTFGYIPTVSGNFLVSVRLGNKDIPGSPFPSTVEPGIPHHDKCLASGMGLLCVEAGIEADFTIFSRDCFGNQRTTGGERFMVSLVGPVSFDATVKDCGNGQYRVTYKTIMCGDYQVHVTLDSVHIPGSPFLASVVPSRTYAPSCTVSGEGSTWAHAGLETTFLIEAKDIIGNRKLIGGDCFSITTDGPAELESRVIDNDDGTYTAAYIATVHGEYWMHVWLDGVEVAKSPFHITVQPGQTVAVRSTVYGDGISVCMAGVESRFIIEARDAFRNRNTAGGDAFTVAVRGPVTLPPVPVTIVEKGEGLYEVTYRTEAAATYFIAVLLGGVDVAGSPFKINVRPGSAWASNCSAHGAGLTGGFIGVEAAFAIQSRDAFGNEQVEGGEQFSVVITGAAAPVATISDLGNGVYSVGYTPTVGGDYTIAVRLQGIDIAGSPFVASVDPLPRDAYKDIYQGISGEVNLENVVRQEYGHAPEGGKIRSWLLTAHCIAGRNLVSSLGGSSNGDFGGTLFDGSDERFVVFNVGESIAKTGVATNSSNPVWNQELTLTVNSLNSLLEVKVFEYDADVQDGEGKSMGVAAVALETLQIGSTWRRWIPLENVSSGELDIQLLLSEVV